VLIDDNAQDEDKKLHNQELQELKDKALERRVTRSILWLGRTTEAQVAREISKCPCYEIGGPCTYVWQETSVERVKGACNKLVQKGYLIRVKKNQFFSLELVQSNIDLLKSVLFDPTSMITRYVSYENRQRSTLPC
jgi:hypothetical protein